MATGDDGAVLTRRLLLTAGLVGTAAIAVGCGSDEEEPVADDRYTYGDDPSQYAELTRPEGSSRGVVVVIHGGFWKSAYDASLGRPLAADLAARGWTAWNIEYRRVGPDPGGGGGVPGTLDDVAAAIDLLADVPDLDLTTVVTLGHSAGGHLATWAAARDRYDWPAAVPVTAVISQAGVLDLAGAVAAGLGTGAVEAFVGARPGSGLRPGGPRPASCRSTCRSGACTPTATRWCRSRSRPTTSTARWPRVRRRSWSWSRVTTSW